MQERDFIPAIGMKSKKFWSEVKSECKKHNADEILIYMKLMLQKAGQAEVQVRKEDFENYGRQLELFNGVEDWFRRINRYGKHSGIKVSHHIISSGIREMISGSDISRYFDDIYASSYCYDHHGVATWPALALNYTTKTQYLFRINKGSKNVYDHDTINKYVEPDKRSIPFSNIAYIGDGETDIPCFRLVKSLGGTSIAVYKPNTKGAKAKSESMRRDGRVNFVAPADYSDGSLVDRIIKAIMDKIAAVTYYSKLSK